MKRCLYLLLFILLTACSSFENHHLTQFKQFSAFSQNFNNPDLIQKENEHQIISELEKVSPIIQKLDQQDHLRSNEQSFYLNYANLNAAYSEYLMQQNCPQLAKSYIETAEKSFTKLLLQKSNHSDYLYNKSIFYARTSIHYQEPNQLSIRINYLEKSKLLAEQLFQLKPDDQKFRNHYFSVLSELLNVFDKADIQHSQQQEFVKILQQPLNEYLANTDLDYDSGNFLILVKVHFNALHQQNPKIAQAWLTNHKDAIFDFFNKHKDDNLQRNNGLTAELYALYKQPVQSLHYLKQLKFGVQDTYTPSDIAKEKAFNSIRLEPKFKNWFKQYSIDYQNYQTTHPKICTREENPQVSTKILKQTQIISPHDQMNESIKKTKSVDSKTNTKDEIK